MHKKEFAPGKTFIKGKDMEAEEQGGSVGRCFGFGYDFKCLLLQCNYFARSSLGCAAHVQSIRVG